MNVGFRYGADKPGFERAQRVPGVDFLRAVAILSVMMYHLSSHGVAMPAFVEHGWLGVDLFFVLSGYLIGWQVLREYARSSEPHWGPFILGRALRILPAYYAVLAFYVLFPHGREGGNIQPLWKFVTFSINLSSNWEHGLAYSHAWSLCVEEHFYLLFPFIVWLLAGRSRSIHVSAVAISLVAGGVLLRAWYWDHQVAPVLVAGDIGTAMRNYVTAIYNPTYARLDGLLAGVMLASVRAFRPLWWECLLRHPWLLLAAGATTLLCSAQIQPISSLGATVLFPLIALGCACLLAGVLSSATWIGRFQLPGTKVMATLAFSLYLTHKQVYAWLDMWLPKVGELGTTITFFIYILASVAIASLLYIGVERPGLRFRERYLHNRRLLDSRSLKP